MVRLDEASKNAEYGYYSADGVHPTVAGRQLIKRACIEAFNSELK